MPTVEEYHSTGGGRKKTGVNAGCTAGRLINASLAVNFFCVLISSLVVVGTLAHLQQQVKDHPDNSTHSHGCILYASHHDEKLHYSTSYSCEYVIATFSISTIIAFLFFVVSVVRVIFATDLWYTSIVEMIILIIGVVMIMVAGVTISIGLSMTCSAVKKFYDSPTDRCDKRIPNSDGFHYLHEVNSTQAGAWFTFMFIAVALLVFIIRVVMFIRRRKQSGAQLQAEDKQSLAPGEKDKLTASWTKPV